ncbi:phage protein Gp27 family protein [Roseobacter sp. S98]|uniref:phage protein Gp27 family protein n=1 Tax=Roseobacter algicola (ex Choi et al. 2025) (nom. illeg.) TaxID=3092138 RepID=UPI0035C68560
MPPPKKLDLVPEEFVERLKQMLSDRGFSDIIEVTEEFNTLLEVDGISIRVGKTAVGNFSKMLKDQREAFSMAETLLSDMDLEAESDMHRTLMTMIATSAMQMMRSVREGDGHLPAGDLMNLGRMLKDLMGSSAVREKLLEDDRKRIAREEREKAAEAGAKAVRQAGMSEELEEQIKASILGIAA